ncbi:5-(carboxyamino)imidazole ribonucleotide synthase [Jatrophihabitans endophyticus]|uniref:N5-carboxyaminoimidazole ribonucleotide synthase n=1 Tax=Jatrophihabitans endophyticus TaxID=1206085 RepID=A0A1M5TT06_9ACTN|nr:5-(carboxyamino)imidazole ribonucleotide synthase [Jatrophihabitans endophyticus]SHH53854.1 5-(carboxyamino)imidazole ribonucleotide synthase [Jatrophihabitans endophyticus]
MDERTGLPVVGMVGAGQLARMTHQAAIPLGQSVRLLADSADDGAALVARDVTVGDYRELADLRSFAHGCDAVTFDHEHVPNAHIEALEADGVNVQPGSAALRFAQDKLAMRERLTALGVPCPVWAPITTAESLQRFGDDAGWPIVLKAATGGYDGKGVWVVDSVDDAAAVLASGTRLLAEEKVEIVRELAADVARSPFGQGAAWPVVETVQRDGICVEVIAPAPELDDDTGEAAQALALRIAHELGVTGVLAVELFLTARGLVVNELAMRPHNSAHWTIEGARTSQFEQHLRAVLDYPLGTPDPTARWTVMVNLLGGPEDVEPKGIDERVHHFMAHWPDVKLHLYGKQFRPGRKVGHVTVCGDDLTALRERAAAAADYLMHGGPHD